MPRKKADPAPALPAHTGNEDPGEFWPDLMRKSYHPDIADAVTNLPFRPPQLTRQSSPEDEIDANVEVIDTVGCHVYEFLRRPHVHVDSVLKLVKTAREFLAMRRKFLNLEQKDDPFDSRGKPKVISIG